MLNRRLFWLSTFIALTSIAALAEPPTGWRTESLSFRALNMTGKGSELWVCGTDEGLAVSSDGGEHWVVKHHSTDGALLLNVGFSNEKFGYAAGSGGLYLTTEDGGETWASHHANADAILQVSFSDAKHGMIRTTPSLLFTNDGGETWNPVSAGQNLDDLKKYRYSFSLVALDTGHMAAMMKQGAAEYEGQGFLITQDSGKSWKFVTIPNTTLHSFLRVGDKYWTIGTEVIHKDQPGGGYGVPVALYSSDGDKWEHSDRDISSCRLHTCVACTPRGCLSANGTITNFFSDSATHYSEFAGKRELTTKWAAAGAAICFVGDGLQCTSLSSVSNPSEIDIPLPSAVGPGPLGTSVAEGVHCLMCALDRIIVNEKAQGSYTIKMTLEIAKNGTITAVTLQDTPTPEVRSRIEQQVKEWIFEPYLKGGVATGVKLNTEIRVTLIKSR